MNKHFDSWKEIYWKYYGKRRNLFHNILLPVDGFPCESGTRFSLQDKRLFDISEVEITRVDCILIQFCIHINTDKGRIVHLSDSCLTLSIRTDWSEGTLKTQIRRHSSCRLIRASTVCHSSSSAQTLHEPQREKRALQSNLVISNSLILNYRLSRSEKLVPVLTWNYDNK